MAGVTADTISLGGEPAHCILDEARAWAADVIVMGRSADTGGGRPRVGAAVQCVLEYAEQPVLVVPLFTARGDHALR